MSQPVTLNTVDRRRVIHRILVQLRHQPSPVLSWLAEDWPSPVWHALDRAAARAHFDIPLYVQTPHALAHYLAGHPGWLDSLQQAMRHVGYNLPGLPT